MFVRYFVDVPVPADVVRRMLKGNPEAWLPVLADRAHATGAGYLTDVGFGEGVLRLDHRVAVRVRPGQVVGEAWVLPIVWEAMGADGLFPSLEADIEVAALGPARTHLSLSGRYRPPGGRDRKDRGPGPVPPGGRGDGEGLRRPTRRAPDGGIGCARRRAG